MCLNYVETLSDRKQNVNTNELIFQIVNNVEKKINSLRYIIDKH